MRRPHDETAGGRAVSRTAAGEPVEPGRVDPPTQEPTYRSDNDSQPALDRTLSDRRPPQSVPKAVDIDGFVTLRHGPAYDRPDAAVPTGFSLLGTTR